MSARTICWFSCGAASAVATKLTLQDAAKTGAKVEIVNIRAFIDEIPRDQATINPIAPSCDFLCHHAEDELAA